jgi:general secretion pathway protein I
MAGRRGFTLLETVVALAIVGLAVVAALEAFGAELRTSARAHRALESEALAGERLARLRLLAAEELASLSDSMARGRFPTPFADYQWAADAAPVLGEPELYEVSVRVTWDDGHYGLRTRLHRRPIGSASP